MARAEAPSHLGVIGLGMAGPTIIAHGTDAQKQKHLEKILSTEEIWCQGFSEPDAGSDLSAVRTTARRWRATTSSSTARRSGRRSRTSPTGASSSPAATPTASATPGSRYLLVDMHAPGVEVRPLRQITGEAEFNEIFFTDVKVPVENVVGEIGGGWQVAMTTLLHERGTLGFALTAGLESQIRKLITLAKEKGATEVQRDAIAREWIGLQAVRYTNYRSLTTLMKTGIPGPEGSGAKLWWSEANQRVTKLALELLGSEAQLAERERERAARLLAAPAAALARQHDRGRHLRDPAQHHRRARARPAEVALMEFAFSQEQEELRREARSFLEANPEAPLADAARARLARRLGPGGARRRRALVRRRGDPVRGGRPGALHRARS